MTRWWEKWMLDGATRPSDHEFFLRDHILAQHSRKYNNPKFKCTILGHYKGLFIRERKKYTDCLSVSVDNNFQPL